jgi:hypothetical protein
MKFSPALCAEGARRAGKRELQWVSKTISETVGQTCRLAAMPGKASHHFGNSFRESI